MTIISTVFQFFWFCTSILHSISNIDERDKFTRHSGFGSSSKKIDTCMTNFTSLLIWNQG